MISHSEGNGKATTRRERCREHFQNGSAEGRGAGASWTGASGAGVVGQCGAILRRVDPVVREVSGKALERPQGGAAVFRFVRQPVELQEEARRGAVLGDEGQGIAKIGGTFFRDVQEAPRRIPQVRPDESRQNLRALQEDRFACDLESFRQGASRQGLVGEGVPRSRGASSK